MFKDLIKAKARTTRSKGSASARNLLGKMMNDKISSEKKSAAEKVLAKMKKK